jgi:hypothetical protein
MHYKFDYSGFLPLDSYGPFNNKIRFDLILFLTNKCKSIKAIMIDLILLK